MTSVQHFLQWGSSIIFLLRSMSLSRKKMNLYAIVPTNYNSILQDREVPSFQRLVSIFVEGLTNKSLHANVYAKKHDTLNSCIKYAIDFDNNCKNFSNVNASARSKTSSTTNTIETGKSHPVDVKAIAEMVMKNMNQVF